MSQGTPRKLTRGDYWLLIVRELPAREDSLSSKGGHRKRNSDKVLGVAQTFRLSPALSSFARKAPMWVMSPTGDFQLQLHQKCGAVGAFGFRAFDVLALGGFDSKSPVREQ